MDAYVDELQQPQAERRRTVQESRWQVVGKRLTYAQVTGRCDADNAGGNGKRTAF